MSRLTLALATALACLGLTAAAAQAGDLDILSFSAPGLNQNQTPSTGAGTRPFELGNQFVLNEVGEWPAENVKTLMFDLPPGIVGNVAEFPQCQPKVFDYGGAACPPDTQIGVANVLIMYPWRQRVITQVYNLEPPKGMPAQFGFVVLVSRIRINFGIRSGTDYGVSANLRNVSSAGPLFDSAVSIWGVPGDPGHDNERGGCAGTFAGPACEIPYPGPIEPLLSNPTSCARPLVNTMEVTTYQHPDEITSAEAFNAPAMSECNQLDFSPTVEAKPTTNLADSPSGLDFHLHIPQNQDPEGSAAAHLRESKVVLPPSLTVNPSSANGLGSCDLSQIGYTGPSNESQMLSYGRNATASYALSFGGESTAPIPANAGRAEVTAALETLPGLAGNVSLRGAPGGWIVGLGGSLAGTDVPLLTGTSTDNSVQTVEVTGTGGGFNLHFGGESAGAGFKASFGAGTTFIFPVNPSRPLKVGDPVEGPGIAPGTTIASVGFGAELSNPTTSAQSDVTLKTSLLFDASAADLQKALREIPALAGNVFVKATGTSGDTRSFEVIFGGDLAGTEPALMSQTSSLSGAGAGVTVAQAPKAPQPLTVITATESGNPQFTPDAANCPDNSKLGTVRIDSLAVIDHPLEGTVYLATPHQNPFNSLVAIYITVADPETGVVVKLPGLVELDPKTGQLTATVSEAPELPFEDLRLEFFKGPGAPLKTGVACGTYQVTTDMVPWSAPEGAVRHPSDTFKIEKGAGAGPCVKDEASAPGAPTFEAGTLEPTAGAYSPFSLKLSRQDGTQQLTGIDTTLPKGLIAKLAGVSYCSEAALAEAVAKAGKAELASPSCPASSRVGTVKVGAGAGPTPFYTQGTAYMAGPYKGAPLSLAVITPAVAGPFDLGDVVVRNALYVDPESAQVRTVSDPLPTILQGIPLALRSIVVELDRSTFTKNPTNCAPGAIAGTAALLSGQSTPLFNRFQVGDCGKLGFKPKLAISLKGGTKRTGHPALKAVLTAREGDANLGAVAVALPKSEFLDNSHIKTICTRVQFAADTCPAGSVYGYARATTPLLDGPLQGPVYLRSSSNKLPDLVADLRGQINVVVAGRIDTTKAGGIRTTFETIPDAPVSKFVLEMQGGKKGLLENSTNLCAHPSKATVLIDGQNGKTADQSPVLATSCKKRGKKARKRRAER